jgi:hypothetical protein
MLASKQIRPTYSSHSGSNPRAMMIKFMDAVIVHATMMSAGWLIEVACVVVPCVRKSANRVGMRLKRHSVHLYKQIKR